MHNLNSCERMGYCVGSVSANAWQMSEKPVIIAAPSVPRILENAGGKGVYRNLPILNVKRAVIIFMKNLDGRRVPPKACRDDPQNRTCPRKLRHRIARLMKSYATSDCRGVQTTYMPA